MIPGAIHPVLMTSMAHILGRLISSNAGLTMQKVLPFPQPLAAADGRSDAPPTLTYWSFSAHSAVPVGSNAQRTRVMATLNATPDSFSDGGVHDSITSALSYATLSAEAEASIIDIGGYSTRPAAAFVTEDDEISRIVPIITSIRASSKTERLPISIDTFRPSVAAAAIQAGANCINDVYAFSGPNAYPPHPDARADEDRYHCGMKALSRQYAVPAILMHSRGDSGQNKDYSEYNYAARPVIEGVQVELGDKVNRIVKGKGGLRRWLVIVDPGVGFSKTLDGNLEILRHRELLTSSIDIGDGKSSFRSRFYPHPCQSPAAGQIR
jgi:dihydroneopterin aldolase/2-amino-4-hydroxy-6-hydroxymethyldihydropteridine diphosphokinase/dihydropteroate synthase